MAGPRRLSLHSCIVDLDQQKVLRDGVALALTGQECAVLAYLAERRGQVVTREALFADVLGYTESSRSRALDAAVRRIRNKVEADPTKPEHVLTIYGEGYRLVTAPPADAPTGPRYGDAFVGREPLVAALRRRVDRGPGVVTVHGPGGVGKTRLVCEALADRALHVVGVAGGTTSDRLAASVARQLGVTVSGSPGLAVGLALASRDVVLVLDSAEIALDAVAELTATWMHSSPGIRVVVTSREPLAQSFEEVVPVGPLEGADASTLLLTRARQALGGRTWPGADPPTVTRLVEALDGLPLALELAAGRAPVLAAPAVLERLEDRFSLLRSSRRGRQAHHGTLWATIDWSWQLLDTVERSALAQLTVLGDPFPFEAAEAVVRTGAAPALDVVQALVRKSLLQPVDGAGCLRMLDGVRAFVIDQTSTEPGDEVVEAARRRLAEAAHRVPLGAEDRLRAADLALQLQIPSAAHATRAALEDQTDARVAVALAERARPRLTGLARLTVASAATSALVRAAPAEVADAWIDALDEVTPGDPGDEVERLVITGRLLVVRGRLTDGAHRLEQALAQADEHRRAALQIHLGGVYWLGGQIREAKRVLAQARAGSAPQTTVWARASVRLSSAVRAVDRDLEQAESLLVEGYEAHQRLGHEAEAAFARANLGNALQRRGDIRGAIAHYRAAIEVLERHGDLRTVAMVSKHLALACDHLGLGDPVPALRQAAHLQQLIGDRSNWALTAGQLARRLARDGDGATAATLVEEAVHTIRAVSPQLEPVLLADQARIVDRLGDTAGADAMLRRALDLIDPDGEAQIERNVYLVRAELGAERDPVRSEADLDHARQLSLGTGGGRPDLRWLVVAARVALARGDHERAARYLAQARARASDVGMEPSAWLARRLDDLDRQLAAG